MAMKRLSSDSWIEAGLTALETRGPSALGAETLARELGASKGSFYWHFKGLPDFHEQLAAAWKRRAATALVTVLEHDDPVSLRLQKIGQESGGETAMRAWACENQAAAGELAEIDQLRLNAMSAVLRDVGVSNPDIARALYGAGLGLASLPGGASDTTMATLIDLVLALR
ncbi:TetR/AcrR family transcriptional regulator [Marimonas arenosa]|uniref:TetR/AcrR family transcriptional regulator n=1 Tax=Marimonas arenosa TaxID=1795305 RepID=A0AAE3WFK7_9RHOB|nr:TetR/AcrR family transcriptional regulator [Marimonas arenosa]MDQ2090775.1 TetR/AcrR family transcriptional regulator [Marimonas arenosa]